MKSGIDYFPLDVTLNDKFELIEAEFGLIGFAVVIKLLQKIYGSEGYYCEWTKEVALLFCKRNDVGGNTVSEIIKACIRRELFDRTMWQKYGILTSAGIQRRYFEAAGRRKTITVKRAYLLIARLPNMTFADETEADVNISDKNESKTDGNTYIGAQENSTVTVSAKKQIAVKPESVQGQKRADDDFFTR